MRGIGALLAARLQQPLAHQGGQQHIQGPVGQAMIGHPGTELGQDRVVEPLVVQAQPQAVLPVDA
jgi:hypothetical protein